MRKAYIAKRMKITQSRPNTVARCCAALTLIEVLVVIAIILILAGLLLPHLAGRGPAKGAVCMSNLKQVGIGFIMWENDHNNKFPMQTSITNQGTMEYLPSGIAYVHFLTITNHLRDPKCFVCPLDKSRHPATNSFEGFNNFNLSYFLSVSSGTNPSAVFLSGDRNLMLDGIPLRRGNVQFTNYTSFDWTTQIHSKQRGNVVFLDGHVQLLNEKTASRAMQ